MGVLDSAISATAQVIPLAATVGVLRGMRRRPAPVPKPRRKVKKKPKGLRKSAIKRTVRKSPARRSRRR